MAPWVLSDDMEDPPWGPPGMLVWVPDTQPPTNTWRLRTSGNQHRDPKLLHVFTQALRVASNIWRNMTDPQKAYWRTYGASWSAQRPGRDNSPDNGWCLFANTALAPCMWLPDPTPALFNPDDMSDPTTINFVAANWEDAKLYFEIIYPAGPNVQDTSHTFIYMVNPLFQAQPDALRRTLLCGYYRSTDPGPLTQYFNVPAAFTWDPADQVRVLARHHSCSHGVHNFDLYQDTT